ncbi:MAG: DUF1028 domain-containing protein [Steroidobacteraceae bacterium]
MTYAIVARDPARGEMGAAVQTHFFNAAGVVLWAEAGAGVVATMAMAETAYGRVGLQLLRDGVPAGAALAQMLARDPGSSIRQVGILGLAGRAAGHTGAACIPAAGHRSEEHVVALGNMLTSNGTWDRMVAAFDGVSGSLGSRLLAAMDAGERAGGDIRGMQSAGLVVVSTEPEVNWAKGEALAGNSRIDLRVEDHPTPLVELRRLLELDGFYKKLLTLIATPGLLAGPPSAAGLALDAAIATLESGQRLLGDNPEATFWLAILLARSGRMQDARRQFEAATRVRPPLREMARRLIAAGMLSTEQFDALFA